MSISKSINEENNISQKENIHNFLTLEKCEDAGLIIEDFKDNILNLGAMNLGYIKVKKLIKELEDKFEIEIKIKQITSLEWESWFEQNYSTSVENIQKKSTSNNNQYLENDFEQYNSSLLKETINTEENNNLYDSLNDFLPNTEIAESASDIELIDDENDEALIRLAQANIGDDSDMDDILFGEELTNSNDPVIAGVASILSKCLPSKDQIFTQNHLKTV